MSQISDGQIQASTSAAKVTQISDGQPQAPKTTSAASKTTVAPVTQISDGQVRWHPLTHSGLCANTHVDPSSDLDCEASNTDLGRSDPGPDRF